MPVTVRLTDGAARDLEDILDYVSRQDAPSRAEHVLDRIEEAFQALSAFPRRGSYPRERRIWTHPDVAGRSMM